jgi:hypothetical protein
VSAPRVPVTRPPALAAAFGERHTRCVAFFPNRSEVQIGEKESPPSRPLRRIETLATASARQPPPMGDSLALFRAGEASRAVARS